MLDDFSLSSSRLHAVAVDSGLLSLPRGYIASKVSTVVPDDPNCPVVSF